MCVSENLETNATRVFAGSSADVKKTAERRVIIIFVVNKMNTRKNTVDSSNERGPTERDVPRTQAQKSMRFLGAVMKWPKLSQGLFLCTLPLHRMNQERANELIKKNPKISQPLSQRLVTPPKL